MSEAVTVPATCTVVILKGGSIDMAGSALTFNGLLIMQGGSFTHDATLTINLGFESSAYDLGFDENYTVTLGDYVTEVFPEWWGIDGTADEVQIGAANTALTNGAVVLTQIGNYAIADDLTIDNELEIRKGCIAVVASGKTLTLTGALKAGMYQVFGGTGTIGWSTTQKPLNQLWFGITDAALVLAVKSLADGVVWHLPTGTYTQTTKITLPVGVVMYGDGIDNTIINSAVSADYAIETADATPSIYKTEIRDLYLLGDDDGTTGSTGTGGIKVAGTDYIKLTNIRTEAFAGGYGTAGTAGTDEQSGIWIAGTVGVTVTNCYSRRNDVGFRINEGSESVNTTTIFRDCFSELNRTHGVLWENTMSTYWDGGVIESNNGLITFLIACAGADQGLGIRNTHFESNQRISGAAASGSINISVDLAGSVGGIILDNITFGSGATYPETIVELTDTRDAIIIGCLFALGATGTNTLEINSSCYYTVCIGNYFSTLPLDSGIGTKFLPQNVQNMTAAGAARLDGITKFNSTAGIMTVTLADGTDVGQRKEFYFLTDGGDVTLTVAKHETSSTETFTFDTAGSYLVLEWAGLVWVTIKNYGVTVP